MVQGAQEITSDGMLWCKGEKEDAGFDGEAAGEAFLLQKCVIAKKKKKKSCC